MRTGVFFITLKTIQSDASNNFAKCNILAKQVCNKIMLSIFRKREKAFAGFDILV